MSYPEAPFLSRTELPIQNTHTTGRSGGPGRRAGGRTTLQTSSNRSDLKPLARTLVTNVVNLRPKTAIFSEKAVGLTAFVTTDRESTQKTPPIDDVCNHTQKISQKSQRTRPLRCTWAVAGPGRALRRRAKPHISNKAPLVWRAPEGPEGTGGLRGAAANEVRSPSLAGGWALRRPEHQRCHTATTAGRPPPTGVPSSPAQPENARRSSPSEPCARAGVSRPGRSGCGPRCAAPRLRCR